MLAIAPPSVSKISAAQLQDISSTGWAFAKLGIHHAPLMDAKASALVAWRFQFSGQEMDNTSWAFSVLLLIPSPLLGPAASVPAAPCQEWRAQELANTAWTFAKIGVLATPFF